MQIEQKHGTTHAGNAMAQLAFACGTPVGASSTFGVAVAAAVSPQRVHYGRTARRARTHRTILCDASGSGNKDADDTNASDLSLPDLRSLFAPSGDPNCEQCEGTGTVVCPVCTGTGYFTVTMMDTVSSSQCRLCKGQKYIPCPSCRQEVYESVLWWDLVPSKEDDPDEKWREGPDGEPRIKWNNNPATGE